MSSENEKILRSLYEAFVAGDLPTVLSFVRDDATFHVQGKNQLAGDYSKGDFAAVLVHKVMQISGGTFVEEVHDIVAGDEHGVALVDHRLTRDGSDHAYRAVHVWHMKDGQASEWWEFPEQPGFDRAWG
jgi:ketosteroid isomerase-like protein